MIEHKKWEIEHMNRATALDQSSPLIQAEVELFPSGAAKEAEKWEHDLPRCYFGEYWCQNFLCYEEPDYADRAAGNAAIEDLTPGVIQQVNPKKRKWYGFRRALHLHANVCKS